VPRSALGHHGGSRELTHDRVAAPWSRERGAVASRARTGGFAGAC